ncbi:hypothetical protein ACJX0J_040044, partial [Zea mays]
MTCPNEHRELDLDEEVDNVQSMYNVLIGNTQMVYNYLILIIIKKIIDIFKFSYNRERIPT